MANLAAAAVTINNSWSTGTSGNPPAKSLMSVDATCVLTGQGGGTNKILASLFGLQNVLSVESVRSSAAIYVGAPSFDATGVLLTALSTDTGTPADVTATVRMVVTGYIPSAVSVTQI